MYTAETQSETCPGELLSGKITFWYDEHCLWDIVRT